MGQETVARRLRVASAVRWVLVTAVTAAQGASGWYFTLFGVYGLEDYDLGLVVSMVSLPLTLLLIALDFRTIRARQVLWTWIALRAIAVPLIGLGVGSLLRAWLVERLVHDAFDAHADLYAWQLLGLGVALAAIEPIVGGVRLLARRVFGRPQGSASRWPGRPLVKWLVGTAAFVCIASVMLTFAHRVYWHIGFDTTSSVPPIVATGTLDGREIAVVGYSERAMFRFQPHARVAAFDLESGDLVWDHRTPSDTETPATTGVFAFDERGAFVRLDHHSGDVAWVALDPNSGRVTTTVEEVEQAAPGIPEDVIERYLALEEIVADDGYDYEFTDEADLERVFRYDDETLIINPFAGTPAGEEHGFTLHRTCCHPPTFEARADDGSVLWQMEGVAPGSHDVVAVTEGGRVVVVVPGEESKGRLLVASRDAVTEAVIGDRGWWPW